MRVFDPNPRYGEESVTETYSETRCPECGSLRHFRDYMRAEVICRSCGLVIEDRIIDPGPDWRGFDTDQRMAREHTGPPTTYTIHDKGLSVMIDPRDYDAGGSPLKPHAKTQMHRLRKWNKRARISDSVERNLSYALSELDRVAGQLRLPRNVREAASMIYRKTVENKLIRGRSIESSTASAIYISCRQFGIPRTLEELSEVTKHNKKEIGKSYRVIARGLGIHLPPINAIDYVPRFTSELGLPGMVETKAIEILSEQLGREPNNPRVRMQLADVLVMAGTPQDAAPVLLSLADDYAAQGHGAGLCDPAYRPGHLPPG